MRIHKEIASPTAGVFANEVKQSRKRSVRKDNLFMCHCFGDAHNTAARQIGAAMLILLGLAGCISEPLPPAAVLVRVGDKILSAEEVKTWESSLPEGKVTPDLRSAFIRNWVEEELLINAARERGLNDDAWIEARMDELHKKLLTSRLLELDAAARPPPSTKEVLEYYDRHADEFIWKHLHLDLIYWRCESRPPLDRLRSSLMQNRPSPLLPGEVAIIDSGNFSIDDPAIVDPVFWKHFGWMNPGQLGFPASIRGSYWMFKLIRRNEAGTRQRLEDVVDAITSRIIEINRLSRRNELVRQYAEQYRRDGRLQWIDPTATTLGTEDENILSVE